MKTVLLIIITALSLAGRADDFNKPCTAKSDFIWFAETFREAPADEQHIAFRSYLIKNKLPSDIIDPCIGRRDLPLQMDIYDNIGLVYCCGDYGLAVDFLVFIDIENGTILFRTPNSSLGPSEIEVTTNPNATPQVLVLRKDESGGTGAWGKYISIYTIDKGHVQLSLEKPGSSSISIFAAFGDNSVDFKQTNDFVVCNGVYEVHSTGIASIENPTNSGPKVRELPQERYIWNSNTRMFDQVEGRRTAGIHSIEGVYGDYGEPSSDWFTKPPLVEE